MAAVDQILEIMQTWDDGGTLTRHVLAHPIFSKTSQCFPFTFARFPRLVEGSSMLAEPK